MPMTSKEREEADKFLAQRKSMVAPSVSRSEEFKQVDDFLATRRGFVTSPRITAPVFDPDNLLNEPVQPQITRKKDVFTYSFPDGRQFRLGADGKPYKTARSGLTTDTKDLVREGSFAETAEEVDHKVSLDFGGTNYYGNIQTSYDTKTILQKGYDFVMDHKRTTDEKQDKNNDGKVDFWESVKAGYNEENRQKSSPDKPYGKMVVEWRAMDLLNRDKIDFWEAMAAVKNHDDKALVDRFLHENFKPMSSSERLATDFGYVKPKEGSFLQRTAQAIGEVMDVYKQPETKQAAMTKLSNFAKSAAIAMLRENLETKTPDRGLVNVYGVPLRRDFVEAKAKQGAKAVTQMFAGSAIRFAVETGMELVKYDKELSAGTPFWKYVVGEDKVTRLSKSGSLEGTVTKFVSDKLRATGMSSTSRDEAGVSVGILFGILVENPFSGGIKGLKGVVAGITKTAAEKLTLEAGEKAMKALIISEFGENVPKQYFDEIASEIKKIHELPTADERRAALDTFVGEYRKGLQALDLPVKKAPLPRNPLLADDYVPGEAGWAKDPSRQSDAPVTTEDFNAGLDAAWDEETAAMKEQYGQSRGSKAVPSSAPLDSQAYDDEVLGWLKAQEEGTGLTIDKKMSIKRKQKAAEIFAADKKAGIRRDPAEVWNEAYEWVGRTYDDRLRRLGAKGGSTASKAEMAGKIEDVLSGKTVPTKKGVHVSFLDTVAGSPKFVLKKLGLGSVWTSIQAGRKAFAAAGRDTAATLKRMSDGVTKPREQAIFRYLDGKTDEVLSGDELELATEVRAWFDDFAKRLGLPESRKISDYAPHIFRKPGIFGKTKAAAGDVGGKTKSAGTLDDSVEHVVDETNNPYLKHREGVEGYEENLWDAMEAYAREGDRTIAFRDAKRQIEEKLGFAVEKKGTLGPPVPAKPSTLTPAQVDYLVRYLENIQGITPKVDELFNSLAGHSLQKRFGENATMKMLALLRKAVNLAFFGGNVVSFMKNLGQNANTVAKIGERGMVVGALGILRRGARAELEEAGVLVNFYADEGVKTYKKTAGSVFNDALFYMFTKADEINRGIAYFGAKDKALKAGKTLEDAKAFAVDVADDAQFTFGAENTPIRMYSGTAKTTFQYVPYTVKQVEFVKNLKDEKNYIGIVRYVGWTFAYYFTIASVTGVAAKDMFAFMNIPGFAPSLGVPAEIVKARLDTPDENGKPRDRERKVQDIAEAGLDYVPGSAQAKKTIRGYDAIKDDDSLVSKAKKLVFGFEKEEEPEPTEGPQLTKDEQKVKDQADEIMALPKSERTQAFKSLMADSEKDAKKVKKYLEDQKLGITEKDSQVRQLKIEDGSRALYIAKELRKLENQEQRIELWNDYAEKGIITKDVEKQIRKMLARP